MKEILLKRCESNGTNDYYFQGLSYIYNFEHKMSTDEVFVYKKGLLINTIYDKGVLTKFINSVMS